MFVPLKWLKEYVEIDDIALMDFVDSLVMSGSKVEAVETLGEEIEKVVVGKILKKEKHPEADKLWITQIDVGGEIVQIVTGAQNIEEGQFVPVVLSGGRLPGGVKIKKGKLRGQESNGMLCSAKELGVPDKAIPIHQKDGIYILDQEYPLGMDIRDAIGIKGHIVEFEITPNRPDCLSMLGIARETAATFQRTVKYPKAEVKVEADDVKDYASVEIADVDLCKRYVARVIKDVTIKESPEWLQRRLIEAGVRPINNIVDITNYVMLEYGQPLHAFDINMISGKQIIVKRADDDEAFTTLDGVKRKLSSSMLTIRDGERTVALAGVMGGENSEVSKETKTILLESANFEKDNIRMTSKQLGLRTEASSRFEKGIDPNICLTAANRVCELVEELGIGTIVKGVIDVYPTKVEPTVIEVRPGRMNQLLGTDLSTNEMKDILERLEMHVECRDQRLVVEVPTFRLDVQEEIDVVEEIGRIYGFNNIQNTTPKGNTQGAKTNGQIIEDHAKTVLNALGVNEIQTYSFIGPKSFDMLGFSENSFMRNVVKVLNPLGEENSIMRTTLMGNMLEVLSRNYNRNVERCTAFEIGNIFIPRNDAKNELPIEKKMLTLGMYGEDVDFYALKGIVDGLLRKMGIESCQYLPERNHQTFHPGRCATIVYGNHIIGTIGEVHPDVAENFDVDTRCYLGELDFNLMMQITRLDSIYKPLPKYPAITRDIAMVVKDEIYVKQIEDIIWDNGGSILQGVKLFDVYKGKQIAQGYKSVAYSLTYRAEDRTLTDEEVSKVHQKIVENLGQKLDAQLRE
ncbi:MAG: phenylalanine--tRNA ligase subunit beta [Bacillota bacterium]